MKFYQVAPYLVIIGLLIYIFNLQIGEINVLVPSKEAMKVITNPQPVVKVDSLYLSSGEIRLVSIPNPVNQELLTKYNQAKDSLSKLQVYKDAITEREYIEYLSDSVQTVTVRSKVIGTLTEQIISYRTNPITITKKSLKSNTEVFIGAFTGLPTDPINNRFTLGANLNIKANKNLYSLGYDTDRRLTLGVSFKLF